MSKDSIIDYLGYSFIRLAGPVIRSLPLRASFFLGRKLGEAFYYLDSKHRAIAYANIRRAFVGKLGPKEARNITKNFYRAFGQNLIEMLLIPLVDEAYIKKYVTIEGKQHIFEAFQRGKGVILVSVHAGSWEFSNIICASLGFDFNLFIRDQRFPRLNGILNSYRTQKGCKIIQKEESTRELIRVLKGNQAIGMTADQGGRLGTPVKFFAKYASMPSGAIRLALKYDSAIIPAFYTRINGPHIKAFVEPCLEIKRTGNTEKDIRDNLQVLVSIFEKYITSYPQEYLWSYKIWKYTKEKDLLILSDGKTGHLRQSQALAGITADSLKDKGMSVNLHTVEISFRNEFFRRALSVIAYLTGKYPSSVSLWSLKAFLEEDSYKTLIGLKPDIVISAGASIAPVNYLISRESLAKSVVIMRPSILNTKKFNLVVMSRHDWPKGHGLASDSQSHRPPGRKNVAVIEGALNLINNGYLKEQKERLSGRGVKIDKALALGVLLGGDTKTFQISESLAKEISGQIKISLEKLDGELLITTSRRTPQAVERLLKEEFQGNKRCKLLIIANEQNMPEGVGGILALSDIVIVSPESISMISEAVSSGKYVVVFDSPQLSRKHRRFLAHFAGNKYIYLVKPSELAGKIEEIRFKSPAINTLRDTLVVSEAIKGIL